MNYLSHGYRFLDDPMFLAGTAVPDWLSVADRSVRMRSKSLLVKLENASGEVLQLGKGILQHLEDDQIFHEKESFIILSSQLGRLFRELPGLNDGFRPGFLGHIVTELLLDRVLMLRTPGLIEHYYDQMSQLDPRMIQSCVNLLGPRETDNLAWFVEIFQKERFLEDYLQFDRLLFRLNQVMKRVRLTELPSQTISVLEAGYELVEAAAPELLINDSVEATIQTVSYRYAG